MNEARKDKMTGTMNVGIGTAKEVAGQILKNENLEAEGTVQKFQGKSQQVIGVLKGKVKEGTIALKKVIEKVSPSGNA